MLASNNKYGICISIENNQGSERVHIRSKLISLKLIYGFILQFSKLISVKLILVFKSIVMIHWFIPNKKRKGRYTFMVYPPFAYIKMNKNNSYGIVISGLFSVLTTNGLSTLSIFMILLFSSTTL